MVNKMLALQKIYEPFMRLKNSMSRNQKMHELITRNYIAISVNKDS